MNKFLWDKIEGKYNKKCYITLEISYIVHTFKADRLNPESGLRYKVVYFSMVSRAIR